MERNLTTRLERLEREALHHATPDPRPVVNLILGDRRGRAVAIAVADLLPDVSVAPGDYGPELVAAVARLEGRLTELRNEVQ